jgi:RNA polymerase sigma-70 factor (ECF subfamily)
MSFTRTPFALDRRSADDVTRMELSMDGCPQTQPSLLIRIRDPADSGAWSRFVEVYTPFIYGVLKRRGLQSADAADVAQEVMQTVAQGISRFEYDRGRGSFRGWLFSVARSRLNDHFRTRQRQPVGTGQTEVHELLAAQPDCGDDGEWERSWQQHLFDLAALRVRDQFEPATWKAFWDTAVEGKPVAEVAAELNLTPGAVYIARSRVMAKLRKIVEEIDDDAAR